MFSSTIMFTFSVNIFLRQNNDATFTYQCSIAYITLYRPKFDIYLLNVDVIFFDYKVITSLKIILSLHKTVFLYK